MRRFPLLLVLMASVAAAQVPTPETFLGYALGERFTPHHRVVDYVEAVGGASPLVTVEHYGETPEGRPLLLAGSVGLRPRTECLSRAPREAVQASPTWRSEAAVMLSAWAP